MNAEELRAEVAKTTWFHSIDLGQGVRTPGYDDSPHKLETLGFPKDLAGKTVLDVGAYDGFFSFEAEKRGAKRVLATDWHAWAWQERRPNKAFELAHRVLGSRVETLLIDVMDIKPETVGTFDLVLFLGVLYHLRYPLRALELMHAVTGDQLVLETHADLVNVPWPAMRFYPGRELNDDATNWWGPNAPAIASMLKDVGFSRVELKFHRGWPYRAVRALRRRVRLGGRFFEHLHQDRLVFHAWK